MSTPASARRLLGRRGECAALDQMVASVRAGPSRALVLRGEAGAGKSALLEYLVQHASGCGVARAAGVESEMELVYAWWRRAGSVPRRPGGAEHGVGHRGGATARLRRGRRAVARRGLSAGAGVCR